MTSTKFAVVEHAGLSAEREVARLVSMSSAWSWVRCTYTEEQINKLGVTVMYVRPDGNLTIDPRG